MDIVGVLHTHYTIWKDSLTRSCKAKGDSDSDIEWALIIRFNGYGRYKNYFPLINIGKSKLESRVRKDREFCDVMDNLVGPVLLMGLLGEVLSDPAKQNRADFLSVEKRLMSSRLLQNGEDIYTTEGRAPLVARLKGAAETLEDGNAVAKLYHYLDNLDSNLDYIQERCRIVDSSNDLPSQPTLRPWGALAADLKEAGRE